MPLYEYRCRGCEEPFEALVPSFREVAPCPACGSSDVEKQLSSFAVTSGAAPEPSCPNPGGPGPGCGGCGCAR